MSGKIDTRAIGLDTGLALIRWLTGAESLHYGDWTGLEVCAANLRRAQDAYTDRVFALLPPAPMRVLDIGGGAGETARRLLGLGHHVEIIVPSAYLAARCRVNAPAAVVHETTLEAFGGAGPFDICLFSESFQYIAMADSLPKCLGLLAPGGCVVIADCFRSDAYRGRAQHGPQPGGGHHLAAFRKALAAMPWTVTHDQEITQAVAPSIDLEQEFFNVVGLGLSRTQEELAARKPIAHWVLARLAGCVLSARKRAQLMERLTGRARNAGTFCTYNHYMLFRLTVQTLPQD